MAFPVTTGNSTGSWGGNGTQTITLPAANSGDLLLVFWTQRTSSTIIHWPAGWNTVTSYYDSGNAGDPSGGAMYKTSDGTEAGAVTVTADSTTRATWVSYTITGWAGAPVGVTPTVDTSTSPQPPNSNPGISKNYKWFAYTTVRGDGSVSAYPSGFSNGQTSNAPDSGYSETIVAELDLAATNETPGTFTISQGGNNLVSTAYVTSVAISPSPSVSPSASPSQSPSASVSPSTSPSISPSVSPSKSPSVSPSTSPSISPSASPSGNPSTSPSVSPSKSPSVSPSQSPSASKSPSQSPSVSPSVSPSKSPSVSPSQSPSASLSPSVSPSVSPSPSPDVWTGQTRSTTTWTNQSHTAH